MFSECEAFMGCLVGAALECRWRHGAPHHTWPSWWLWLWLCFRPHMHLHNVGGQYATLMRRATVRRICHNGNMFLQVGRCWICFFGCFFIVFVNKHFWFVCLGGGCVLAPKWFYSIWRNEFKECSLSTLSCRSRHELWDSLKRTALI